jgi:hypothetical protein
MTQPSEAGQRGRKRVSLTMSTLQAEMLLKVLERDGHSAEHAEYAKECSLCKLAVELLARTRKG